MLGLSYEFNGELLLPVGTVYDPFVARGLDALNYATYVGAKFLFAGTPSGLTLSREGGAPPVDLHAPGGHGHAGADLLRTGLCRRAGVHDVLGGCGSWRTAKTARACICGCPPGRSPRQYAPPPPSGGGKSWPAATGCAITVRRRTTRNARAYTCSRPASCWRRQCRPAIWLAKTAFTSTSSTSPAPTACSATTSRPRVRGPVFPTSTNCLPTADRQTPAITLLDGHPLTLAWLGTVFSAPVKPSGRGAIRPDRLGAGAVPPAPHRYRRHSHRGCPDSIQPVNSTIPESPRTDRTPPERRGSWRRRGRRSAAPAAGWRA